MCGICGIINFDSQPVSEAAINVMMRAMKHRGPDDEGTYIDQNLGLGHVRLSIIDLSASGHQPMTDESEHYFVVFNGEIYNYLELRSQLSSKYNFRTKTDTEVLLYAYLEWGEQCLDRFNGMFAFAIYNKKEKNVFIARDRFGIKPVYYYTDSKQFIFASDFSPILEAIKKPVVQNDRIIYDYLAFNRTNHTEETFFEGIKKLQHGHTITITPDQKNIEIKRWYALSEHVGNPFNSPEELKAALIESIKFRLRSDVPVGTCLSGGLDSSSIVSLILNYFDKPDLYTYSAIYNKGDFGDESDFIDLYRAQLQNMKFTTPTADSLYTDLDHFVTALSEPVPSSSEYAEFKVMELAKDYSTVILNGQGADEQMAGYLYFSGFYYVELMRKIRFIKLLQEMYYDIKHHNNLTGISSFLFFLSPSVLKRKALLSKANYLSQSFTRATSGSKEILDQLYSSKSLKQSFIDHFEHKFEHHLIWADRSGMWFSLETRFPFLDHNFVERMIAVTPEHSINKGWTKYMMRQAMEGVLPEPIRWRKDKVGYETPENDWFRQKKFQEMVRVTLDSKTYKDNNYIDLNKAKQLYNNHLSGKQNAAVEIWKWINLDLWFKKFIYK